MEISEKVAGLIDSEALLKAKNWYVDAFTTFYGKIAEYILRSGAFVAGTLVKALVRGEDNAQDAFGELAATALQDMFGVDVSPAAMKRGAGRGARVAASQQIGDMMIRAFSGQVAGATGGAIEPSDAPAKVFLSAMAQMALEGWLEGWLVEALTLGQLETFGDLDDTMSHVLGLGRASAAVHGPLVKHMIVTPLEWKIQKEHRPSLLSESMAVRQFLRGHWSREQLNEELARQGWSADRIEAHINSARKFISLDDAMLLVREGKWSRADVLAYLQEQGHDESAAQNALVAAEVKRIAAARDDSLSALKSAYVQGHISESAFRTYLQSIVYDQDERSALETAMRTAREVNVKSLSPAEAKACVKQGILAVSDYRHALQADGYDDTAVFALELLLRKELDDAADLAEQAHETWLAREAERLRREEEARQRKAQVDAERALHRRGSLASLERAVVRGLIPVPRYVEVLTPQYDADTVQILTGIVEQARADYLTQQQRAEDARKRAAIRNIDVGALEQAVQTGILTLNEFRDRLGRLGFSAPDAGLLTSTLDQRMRDAATAQADREKAKAAAAVKSIDLGRFERLVVRGVRTLDQYAALLAELGFDAGSRAAMVDLLKLQIADAAAAVEARRLAALKASTNDVTLEQMRRAVVRGLQPEAAFQTYLVRHGFTTDAQAVLLAELRADVADTAAAQADREKARAAAAVKSIDIGRFERLVVRGVRTLDQYAAMLAGLGFDADSRAAMGEILKLQIADAAAAVEQRRLAALAASANDVTPEQMRRAVVRGLQPEAAFQAYLARHGFTTEAQAVLLGELRADVADAADAQADREKARAAAAVKSIDIGRFERLVVRGVRTLDQYAAMLAELGFDADSRAAMGEILKLQIADAAAAVEQRRLAALAASTQDITLEQMRRAVIVGLQSEAAFHTYLVKHGFTADAQAVLLAELRADVADAEAARQRRAAADAASQVRALPLSTLARAARLGLVSLDVYDRRLVTDGYSDDDRKIEMWLLAFERDEAAAARAKRDAPPPAPDAHLSVAQYEAAVKAGAMSLYEFRANVQALGYDDEESSLLTVILTTKLQGPTGG